MSQLPFKILVIEDNPLNLELVTDLLEIAKFHVLGALNGEAGICLAEEERPDLILMDISLPGIDGLEATRRIKSRPELESIPVVAVTAHSMKGDRERVEGAGCSGYITKPINTRTFVETVSQFLA